MMALQRIQFRHRALMMIAVGATPRQFIAGKVEVRIFGQTGPSNKTIPADVPGELRSHAAASFSGEGWVMHDACGALDSGLIPVLSTA